MLPTLSKVCESIIHKRLLSHCIDGNIISERQAAYLQGDSTISQLIYIVHQIRSSWNRGKVTQGIFLDISSAFDKVWHKGLLAKLAQIGIEDSILELFSSYLSDRRQTVVVEGIKSSEHKVKAGVPQGSRLGPLLFLIYINDIVNDLESDILLFADDTTILATGIDPFETCNQLNRDLLKISNWAAKWKVTFNPAKSKDMIFTNKQLHNSPEVLLNNTPIERINTHKHLGVYLTSSLDWSLQITQLCLKANRKLAVLRSVKFLQRKTLDMLYKVTVRSVIDYGLPIYYNNLRQTEMKRLDKIQYTASKIVTGALHYSSQAKLEKELGWETLKSRSDYLGVTLLHKIHLHQTRPLLRSLMPPVVVNNGYNLRTKGGYKVFPWSNLKFSKSFFPYFINYWNNLQQTARCLNLPDFKVHMSSILKPPKYKHFSNGSKLGNSLLTQLRVGRSTLNAHTYSLGLTDSPACSCGFRENTTLHFLLDCQLFYIHRLTLFNKFEQYIPDFKNMSRKNKMELLLNGKNINNSEYSFTNRILTLAMQKFLLDSR